MTFTLKKFSEKYLTQIKLIIFFIVSFLILLFIYLFPNTPQEYFKNNRTGVSPDYGVYYDGNLDDHVVTIHGFWDDQSVCTKVAEMLEKISNKKSYSCRQLN